MPDPEPKRPARVLDAFWDWLILSLLTIVAFWLAFIAVMLHGFVGPDGDWPEWGQFGDTFNILTSLFSGLAFAVIAISLVIQRSDFARSIKEMGDAARAAERLAEQTRIDRSDRHAEIYREFNSPAMRRARTLFWEIATQRWFTSESYRNFLTYYSDLDDLALYRAIEAEEARRLGTAGASGGGDVDPGVGLRLAKDDLRYMHDDLVNFFAFIHDLHRGEPDRLREVAGTFYYFWWRGYLLSWALCSRRAHAVTCAELGSTTQLPLEGRIASLLALDTAIAQDAGLFEPETHPYYRAFAGSIRETPETFFPQGEGYLSGWSAGPPGEARDTAPPRAVSPARR